MQTQFSNTVKILTLTLLTILVQFSFGLGFIFFKNENIGIIDIIICVAVFILFMILLKAYLNKIADREFSYLGFDLDYMKYDISAGLIYATIFMVISSLAFFLVGLAVISVNTEFNFFALGFFIIYCFYEGVSQEILFRCLLFRSLNESTTIPTNIVIILVNIIFALLSIIGMEFSLLKLVSLFLVGLMFSMFYKKHRNLYIPIAFHTLLKFGTVAFLADSTKYTKAKFMSFKIINDGSLPKILADSFTDIYINPIFIALVIIVTIFLYLTADNY